MKTDTPLMIESRTFSNFFLLHLNLKHLEVNLF